MMTLEKINTKKNTQLFRQYFMNYLTSILIPFIILSAVIIAIGVVYIVTYENRFYQDAKQQSASLLEDKLNTATNIYAALCSNSSADFFLHSNSELYNNFQLADKYQYIDSYISMFLLQNQSINSIGIYSRTNNVFILNTSNMRYPAYTDNQLYQSFVNNVGKRSFWSEYSETPDGIPIISLFNTVADNNGTTGFIVVNFNLIELRNEYNKIMNSDKYNVIIANNDSILFSLHDDIEHDITDLRNNAITAQSPWEVFSAFYTYSNTLPIALISYVLFIILIMGIIMAIIIRISYKLAHESYIPIEDTLKYIQTFDTNNLSDVLSEYDEINLIFENLYNQKMEYVSLKAQFEKAVMQINSLRETVLESQIKPHFLYNTLEIINLEAYALSGGNNVVTKMILALSDLLKLSFKRTGKLVKVSEELEHVKQYIYLNSIKYENCFETIWDIDDSILEYSTTKLILQPIAENAIIHGVVPAKRFCTISVKAYSSGNNILFEISDNGVGIKPDILENLQNQLSDETMHNSYGIGLDNVNQRIKIIYGKDYGCTLSSGNGMTIVTIKIPKKP